MEYTPAKSSLHYNNKLLSFANATCLHNIEHTKCFMRYITTTVYDPYYNIIRIQRAVMVLESYYSS